MRAGLAGVRAWSVRRKVTVYVSAQLVVLAGFFALTRLVPDIPVVFVVVGCVGPAVGGLVGLLSATRGRSGPDGARVADHGLPPSP
ncbi:hypothetical protein ACWCWD_33065 [Streptomyces sp. NPDC001493]